MNLKKLKRLIIPVLIFAFTFGGILTPLKAQAQGDYSIKNSYNRVSKTLENVRKLKFKKQVPYSIKTRDFLRQFITKSLKSELTPQKFKSYDVTLKLFGFIPWDFKTWDFLIDLYTSEVAGLYDYHAGALMLMKETTRNPAFASQDAMLSPYGISTGDILLVHEMQHALQDQYFNLKKLLDNVKRYKCDDFDNAVQALIEGDATIIMMYYMFDAMSQTAGIDMSQYVDVGSITDTMGEGMGMPATGSAQFEKAPLYFKRTMLFPYLYGMRFVGKLKEKGGWGKVNQAFRKPPRSTEQIYHPERYLMNDEPIIIRFTELPKSLGGWKMMDQNTCGELIIRTLFENFLSGADSRLPSEGWGGDTYRIYEKNNTYFLVWFTTWDRNQDAKEFLQYYLTLLKKKYPNIQWTKSTPNKAYLGRVGQDHVYLGINGKDVVVIERCPPELTQAILKMAWYVQKVMWKM